MRKMGDDKNSKLSISTEDLRSRREEIAGKLYEAKHDTPEHATLEQQFNVVERELFVRSRGDPAKWKDKHDVRHCFKFIEKTDAKGILELRAEMANLPGRQTEYTLRSPDEVINWRNTSVGEKKDAALRRALAKGEIDDAGHLIALFFGSDPAERKNLAAQNCVQNQAGGSWFGEESALKKELETGAISSCRLRVTIRYTLDSLNRRGFAWHMDASGVDRGGKPTIFNGNLYHLNPVQYSDSRAAAYEHARQTRQAVKRLSQVGPPVLRVIK